MAYKKNEAKIKFIADTSEYQAEIKKAENEMTQLRAELKRNAAEMQNTGETTKKLKKRHELLSKELQAQQKKTEELNKKLQKAKEIFGEDSDEVKKLQTQLTNSKTAEQRFQNEIDQTNAKLKTNAKNFGLSAEKAKKFEDATKKAADVSGAIVAGLVGTAAATVKQASTFEDAMAKVSTIAEDTEVNLNGSSMSMRDAILQLSNETGREAADIADAVYSAISAGQSTAEAVNFVAKSSKLAKSGFTEVEKSTDILTTALNAYKLESEDTTKVADYLITTQNLGKVTVDQLASSMGKVIPTAKANNVAIDQLSTGYVMLTKQGINANQSTTLMKSLFAELGKAGTKVYATLKEKTGKSFSELMESGWSVTDVLQVIQEKADADGKSMSDMFAKTNSASAAVALFGKDGKEFNDVLEDMRKSTGATDEAFDKLKTSSAKTNIAINKIKNNGIEIGTVILKELEPTIDDLFEYLDEKTKWVSKHSDEVVTTMKTIGTVAGTVFAINKVAKITQSLITVGGAIQGVTSKIGALIAGRVAETAAVEAETVATEELNIAQSATPWGLIALGAAAVVGTIWAVSSALRDNTEYTDENIEATERMLEEYEKMDSELEQNEQSREEKVQATEEEAAKAELLADKIEQLTTVENKSAKQKEQLKEYVKQLNEIYPDLNLKYDEEKDKLNKTNREIRKNIKLKEEQARITALKEVAGETLKDVTKREIEQKKLENDLTKQEEELAKRTALRDKAEKRLQKEGFAENGQMTEKYEELKAQAEEADAAVDKYQKEVDKTKIAMIENKDTLDKLNESYESYTNAANALIDSQKIQEDLEKLTAAAKKAGVKIPKAVREGIENGKYAVPESVEGLQNLIKFNKMAKKAEDAGIDVPKKLANKIASGKLEPQKAIEQMERWIDFQKMIKNAELTGTKIPKEMKQSILSGKTKPKEAVEELKNEISKVNFKKTGEVSAEDFMKGFQNLKTIGKNFFGSLFSINSTKKTTGNQKKKAAHNAKGNIIKNPTLTYVAEEVPEAIIPINQSKRSINLWMETGRQIGLLSNQRTLGEISMKSSVNLAETNRLLKIIATKSDIIAMDGTIVSEKTASVRDRIDGKRVALANRRCAYE